MWTLDTSHLPIWQNVQKRAGKKQRPTAPFEEDKSQDILAWALRYSQNNNLSHVCGYLFYVTRGFCSDLEEAIPGSVCLCRWMGILLAGGREVGLYCEVRTVQQRVGVFLYFSFTKHSHLLFLLVFC